LSLLAIVHSSAYTLWEMPEKEECEPTGHIALFYDVRLRHRVVTLN
jgi:hypothetical protein